MSKSIAEQVRSAGMDVDCFLGRTAGEFRERGFDVPMNIPACAVLHRDGDADAGSIPLDMGDFAEPTGYEFIAAGFCVDGCRCAPVAWTGDAHAQRLRLARAEISSAMPWDIACACGGMLPIRFAAADVKRAERGARRTGNDVRVILDTILAARVTWLRGVFEEEENDKARRCDCATTGCRRCVRCVQRAPGPGDTVPSDQGSGARDRAVARCTRRPTRAVPRCSLRRTRQSTAVSGRRRRRVRRPRRDQMFRSRGTATRVRPRNLDVSRVSVTVTVAEQRRMSCIFDIAPTFVVLIAHEAL